jgi:hypothetical protein
VAPDRLHGLVVELSDVAAVHRYAARRKRHELQDRARERRLPAARLADHAERLARRDREIDAGDGFERCRALEDAAAEWITDLDSLGNDERALCAGAVVRASC